MVLKWCAGALVLGWITAPVGSLWAQTQPDTSTTASRGNSAMETQTEPSDSVAKVLNIRPRLFELVVTDSMIHYTDYEHFGDILALCPGLFVFESGSVGQPVAAAVVPAPRSLLHLRINEIPILDPETNQVDWNWVPVEGVARLESKAQLFSANTIRVVVPEAHGQAPESKITYRTGSKDFDQFDAGLGLWLSEKRTLQLGGMIKNYNDPGRHNKFDAVNVRAILKQKLKPGWDLAGLFYLNKREIQLLLPTFATWQPPETEPSEKVQRFDYGLVVNGHLLARDYQDFQLIVHHTRLNREFHDWPQHQFWQNHLDLSGVELRLKKSARSLDQELSLVLRRHAFTSPELGDHCDWQVRGKWQSFLYWTDRLIVAAGLELEKYGKFSAAVLPTGLLEFRLHPNMMMQFGSQVSRFYPSFRERFQQTGPIKGNSALNAGTFFENFLAFRATNRVPCGIKFAYSALSNVPMPEASPIRGFMQYANQPQSRYFTSTLDLTMPVLSWLVLGGQGNFLKKLAGANPEPWPDYFANAYIGMRRNLFQNNLDLTLRLGTQLWGPRPAEAGRTLTPVAIPSARVTGQIGAVTLFFALHNFIDSQYDLIDGYPMRDLTLRWGLTWRFYD